MRRTIGLAVLAAALGGCAFKPQLRDVVIDHNMLVAESEDQLTLLNIVRAKERFPMHFTTITALRGGATVTAGGEIGTSFPLGLGGEDVFDGSGVQTSSKTTTTGELVTPKLSGSISTNPSFDVAVLNTDKFQRGIQRQVETSLIEYFLQQGWRDDLLMALFIERIDLVADGAQEGYADGETIFSLLNANSPSSASEVQSTLAWRCFLHKEQMVPRKKPASTTDLVALGALMPNSSLQELALLDGKAFDLSDGKKAGTKPGMVQRITPGGTALGFKEREWTSPAELAECNAAPAGQPSSTPLKALQSLEISRRAPGAEQFDAESGTFLKYEDGDPDKPKIYQVSIVPVLRSIQGVIYFVGEYSRAEEAERYTLPSGGKLFSLHRGSGSAAVATHFRGERYFIADADGSGGRNSSLQVIDLIQQLLNLHKSAEDLPVTRSVTVVR